MVRHFIKVPQTMACDRSQHHGLDQFRRFGRTPRVSPGDTNKKIEEIILFLL